MRAWKSASRAVRFRLLAISESARLGSSRRARSLERVVITSKIDDSVEKTKAHCSAESLSVIIMASVLKWGGIQEL